MTIAAPALAAEHERAASVWRRLDAMSVAGFASIGAGAVHAATIGAHVEHDQAKLTFTIVAAFQILWGVTAATRRGRLLAAIGVVGNLALIAGWVIAKREGIGFIEGLDTAESVRFGDAVAAGFALLSVSLALLAVRGRGRVPNGVQRIGLGALTATVLVLSVPAMGVAAQSHEHDERMTAAHGDTTPAGAATPADDHTQAVAPVPYDPAKPIDLGGVPGVTEAQQARAENLVAATLTALPKWSDPLTAEAGGYFSIGDGAITGYEHYINPTFQSDGHVLDPERPESLVYQHIDGTRKLVAAMYMAEPGTTLETTPELGGALTQWHIHDNLCFTPAGGVAGLTDGAGKCAPGLIKPEAVPMIHVWIIGHPCGPFAALDGIAGGSIKPGETRLCDTAHGSH